jgi:hypothetical protein
MASRPYGQIFSIAFNRMILSVFVDATFSTKKVTPAVKVYENSLPEVKILLQRTLEPVGWGG